MTQVVIDEKGVSYQKKGQTWIYRNNVISYDETIENGSIVEVVDEKRNYIGTGFFSKQSHVTVRILTRNKKEKIDESFFMKKIRFAYAYRKTVETNNLTNCRLIFGEADGLPGLTVDRYNDVLVSQITTYGMEIRKDLIYSLLLKTLREDEQVISGIYERNDVKVREKEGLSMYKAIYGKDVFPLETTIVENGLKLHVDMENGQKTGYFLDQKSNRVLIRNIAKGMKVCDCFSHTGGFALNAAFGGAKHVVAVDVSQTALNEGKENAKLNGIEDRMEFVQADVFDYLDTIEKNAFDLIILDPPAFTKNRRTVDHAYKGYKEINSKAMKALAGGGYLATCSCSRYMETSLFEQMLKEAALESNVTLRQITVTQQNSDHPILWTMEESSYLKFFLFQII